jgi:formate dehydrogenase maturation protein FdhE
LGLSGIPEAGDRLQTAFKLKSQYGNLAKLLELEEMVLKVQHEIEKSPSAEAFRERVRELTTRGLIKESLMAKKPLNRLFDAEVFSPSSLDVHFRRIATILVDKCRSQLDSRKLKDMMSREIDLNKLMRAALAENEPLIEEQAACLGVEPAHLMYAASQILRPFFEELARSTDPSFYEGWRDVGCPICGRMPNLAKIRNRTRYLVCTFCGAEYASDYFLCVHCMNRDPPTLKYLVDEKDQRFRISFCEKCRRYIKTIDEDVSGEKIQKGFEDILTLGLDLVASNKDLKRGHDP